MILVHACVACGLIGPDIQCDLCNGIRVLTSQAVVDRIHEGLPVDTLWAVAEKKAKTLGLPCKRPAGVRVEAKPTFGSPQRGRKQRKGE